MENSSRPPCWSLSRILATAGAVALLGLVLWLALWLVDVLLLTLLAVLMALLMDGGSRLLRGVTGLSRGGSFAATTVVLFGLLAGGAVLVAPQVAEDAERLGERIPKSLNRLDDAVRDTSWGRVLVEQLGQMEESGSLREGAQRFLGIFSSALGMVTGLLLVLVLGAFLASEPGT